MKLKSILSSLKLDLSLSRLSTIAYTTRPFIAEKSEDEQSSDQEDRDFLSKPPTITRWGSLEIHEELGHGAFGTVYRAWDPVLRRDVALKLFIADQGQIEEARKLALVNSPNIVKIFRYESHEGRPGLAMELLKGTTLAAHLTRHGPLACRDVAAIVGDLCRAVATVHNAGILHRDVKAQNVMLEATGRVVLMDFGLGENIGNDAAMQTLAGTLPYIAPELFSGGKASVQTDIYSLGILLYFLVSGKYPVQGKSIAEFRTAHLSDSKVALRKRISAIPFAFTRIVDRAIAANPSDRYSSAEEMAAALAGFLKKLPLRKTLLAVAGVTVLIVSSGFYLSGTRAATKFTWKRMTTVEGLSKEPTISADGKMIAYSSDEGAGHLQIWVQPTDAAPGSGVAVTHSTTNEGEPTLSPDASKVIHQSDRSGGIYLLDIKTGKDQLVIPLGHEPKFSPDGMAVTVWTGNPGQFAGELGKVYVIPLNDLPVSAENIEKYRVAREFIDARHPAWSPDGREILLQGCDAKCVNPENETDWWRVRLDGTNIVKTHILEDLRAQGLSVGAASPAWLKDTLIFSGQKAEDALTALWEVPLSKPFWQARYSAIPLLQSTKVDYVNPSASRNGKIIFTELTQSEVNLWKAKLVPRGQEKPDRWNTNKENKEIDAMPTTSADGRRVLYFLRIGNTRWMMLKENQQTVLSRKVSDAHGPSKTTRGILSSSGDLIAYSTPGITARPIYIMRAPDWRPELVTEEGGEVLDIYDHDRRLLISINGSIVDVEIGSSRKTTILQKQGFNLDQAAVSPDGRWITFLSIQDDNHSRIYIAPLQSSLIQEQKWMRITSDDNWYDTPRWTRDGQTIVFLSKRDTFSCIWKQALDRNMQVKGIPEELVEMHAAYRSPTDLSRVSFNLSVTQDSVIYNAVDLKGHIWIAQ